jgi:hypothetical protein
MQTSADTTPHSSLENRLQIPSSQVAANLERLGGRPLTLQAQEVYLVAMHRQYLHIIHGPFNESEITIAWSGKPPKDHLFRVNVSRDYNMLEKEGFVAATRVLTGMFAHILSKEAKIGALQVAFGGTDAAGPAGMTVKTAAKHWVDISLSVML